MGKGTLRVVRAVLVLLALLAVPAGCKPSREEGNVQYRSEHDVEMNQAIGEAKKRWPEFTARYASAKPGEQFSVKHPFPTKNGGNEHIWIGITEIADGRITGTIDNEPIAPIGHEIGDRVTFPIGEISDWLIMTEGTQEMTGGFTIKVMMARQKGRQ